MFGGGLSHTVQTDCMQNFLKNIREEEIKTKHKKRKL